MGDCSGIREFPVGLIFTDLDGTLLDHHTYDFSKASGAVARAKRCGAELILCSSKSSAEMLHWQKLLGISGPFVAENGGAVVNSGGGLPDSLFPSKVHGLPAMVRGTPVAELRRSLDALKKKHGLPLKGMGDMSIGEFAELTGMSPEMAGLAHERDFDEPFLWLGPPVPERERLLEREAARLGLRVERGGRFFHLLSHEGKGRAVRWLADAYEGFFGVSIPTLGLGDSENDFSMLRETDRGVLVKRPDGSHAPGADPGWIRAASEGPAGWGEEVEAWLMGLGVEQSPVV